MQRPGSVASPPLARLTRIQILECATTGTNDACSGAQETCNDKILNPLYGEWDIYYVLDRNPSNYPADFSSWLDSQKTKIGAEVAWTETSYTVYQNFFETGSCGRHVRPIPYANVPRGYRRLDED